LQNYREVGLDRP